MRRTFDETYVILLSCQLIRFSCHYHSVPYDKGGKQSHILKGDAWGASMNFKNWLERI